MAHTKLLQYLTDGKMDKAEKLLTKKMGKSNLTSEDEVPYNLQDWPKIKPELVFKGIFEKKTNVVKYLVELLQLDINEVEDPNCSFRKEKAIHLVARCHHIPLLEYLVYQKKAGVDIVNKYGESPLHLAINEDVRTLTHEKASTIFKILVSKENVNMPVGYGTTYTGCAPIHVAADLGLDHWLALLIKYPHTDIFAKSKKDKKVFLEYLIGPSIDNNYYRPKPFISELVQEIIKLVGVFSIKKLCNLSDSNILELVIIYCPDLFDQFVEIEPKLVNHRVIYRLMLTAISTFNIEILTKLFSSKGCEPLDLNKIFELEKMNPLKIIFWKFDEQDEDTIDKGYKILEFLLKNGANPDLSSSGYCSAPIFGLSCSAPIFGLIENYTDVFNEDNYKLGERFFNLLEEYGTNFDILSETIIGGIVSVPESIIVYHYNRPKIGRFLLTQVMNRVKKNKKQYFEKIKYRLFSRLSSEHSEQKIIIQWLEILIDLGGNDFDITQCMAPEHSVDQDTCSTLYFSVTSKMVDLTDFLIQKGVPVFDASDEDNEFSPLAQCLARESFTSKVFYVLIFGLAKKIILQSPYFVQSSSEKPVNIFNIDEIFNYTVKEIYMILDKIVEKVYFPIDGYVAGIIKGRDMINGVHKLALYDLICDIKK